MKFMSFVLVLLVANALAGCMQVNDLDDGLSAETESALVGSNALLTNSIDLNGLLSNSIDLNGIDPEMLSPTVLTSLRDSGQIGENTRLLYSYLVGCALDPSQSISFSWTDSFNVVHYERYWGAMGLAPTWKYTSITPSTRRSVSACLGARANYYGYTVIISLRGPQSSIKNISTEERTAFPMEEGVFWGDLFDGTPQLYSCYKSANIANSRAKYRECAGGHVNQNGTTSECSHIAIRGNCDTLCDPTTSNDPYHPRCTDPETGPTNDVITVYLPQ